MLIIVLGKHKHNAISKNWNITISRKTWNMTVRYKGNMENNDKIRYHINMEDND